MPESHPPRRSPPRYRPGSPRRRSPSPRGRDYPPRFRDSRRPPSPPGRYYSPRRDDYHRDRDSRYSRRSPDDRRDSRYDRDRYDDRRRFSERDRGPDSRYRERSPIYRSRRSPPPPTRSRSRSRPRRSRSRTPPRREATSPSRPAQPGRPVERAAETRPNAAPEAGPSKATPVPRSDREPGTTHGFSQINQGSSGVRHEGRPPPTQPSAERKPLAVKTEGIESAPYHVIPTGPRAHAHLQDSHNTRSPRLPTGPLADRQGMKEADTPSSGGGMKKEVHHLLPITRLYDPVSDEEKIRRQRLREEKKREEGRGREVQRQLDRAMDEYEMARLELNAIEKRRALAEAQLEQLLEADVV